MGMSLDEIRAYYADKPETAAGMAVTDNGLDHLVIHAEDWTNPQGAVIAIITTACAAAPLHKGGRAKTHVHPVTDVYAAMACRACWPDGVR